MPSPQGEVVTGGPQPLQPRVLPDHRECVAEDLKAFSFHLKRENHLVLLA